MRRESEARRARNGLAWGLVGFVALQLGAVGVMERWRPELRDPQFAHKAQRLKGRLRGQAPGARPKLVCVFGTSRTTTGLRGGAAEPEFVRRLGAPVILYNFGIPADPPCCQLVNLERLLAEGIRPDLVVLEVFPYYLRDKCTDLLAILHGERLGLRDRAALSGAPRPLRDLRRWDWRYLLASWYFHRLDVLSVLVPQVLYGGLRQDLFRDCDASGFAIAYCDDREVTRTRALEAARAQYGPQLNPFRFGGPFPAAVEQFLARCHQESIPAALLLMPEGPAFQRLYARDAWPQVESYLHELAGKYGTPVINARDWFGEEAFMDSHHLRWGPAGQFAQRLADEALLPLLRGTAPPAGRPAAEPCRQ
jgi:hypothetical protein